MPLCLAQALVGLRSPPAASLSVRGIGKSCAAAAFAPSARPSFRSWPSPSSRTSYSLICTGTFAACALGEPGSYISRQLTGFIPYWHGIARSTRRSYKIGRQYHPTRKGSILWSASSPLTSAASSSLIAPYVPFAVQPTGYQPYLKTGNHLRYFIFFDCKKEKTQ